MAVSQPAIPDTPAGRTLTAWLAAYNSNDRDRVAAYIRDFKPDVTVDDMLASRAGTGPANLAWLRAVDPLHIRFRVQAPATSQIADINLIVVDGKSPSVTLFAVRQPLPPGAVPADVNVDAALRKQLTDGVSAELRKSYVDPALGGQMADAIRRHAAAGAYDAITDPDLLALHLTDDLRAISHDLHLAVNFAGFDATQFDGPPPPALKAQYQADELRHNCGFDKVEILQGDIGYLKFDGFSPVDLCAPTANAAMAFVAHTDALIFDLRDNGGGDPAMVAYLESYLFDKATHLDDIYDRRSDETRQFWTGPVAGDRMASQPVFVLTSKRTFSAAEQFSYDLKALKRATLVGEVTGGGAHPVAGHVIARYFIAAVPFGKSVNPVTKGNWEGTGVAPDVSVAADDVLAKARELAAAAVSSHGAPPVPGPASAHP
jgi:hypothetical protein